MTIPNQLAKHFREVYFGGNWTAVNLKDTLTGVNWQQATTRVHDLNTIAALVFHINYYVEAVSKVLQEQALDAHDKFSFDVPAITSEDEWQQLTNKAFANAQLLTVQIEQVNESKLFTDFADPKYGNYFRNLMGLVEHTHYHLGQIVLVKKIILSS
jgi:hypothetical protein